MKKTKINKRKLNNAGLTLVEILVAIAILSIAIVPLMYGFVYVAKHNANAKHMQQTSVVAHSIIEKCKAYDMEEIQSMVAGDTFLPDADDNIDATIPGSSQYVFYFDDVNIFKDNADSTNVSTQVYDVAMTIEAYGSEKPMMKYSDMNKYRDAVFTMDGSICSGTPPMTPKQLEDGLYVWALDQIRTKILTDITAEPISIDDIADSMKSGGRNNGVGLLFHRSIKVDAAPVGTTGERVVVYYVYTYSLANNFKYDAKDAMGNIIEKNMDCNSTYAWGGMFPIYNNTDTSNANLENLYLFYYPVYNVDDLNFYDSSTNVWKDSIIINNSLGRDLNVYLLKQIRSEMNMLDISYAENTYKPVISGTASGMNKIKLHHNLSENIGGGSYVGWSPSDVEGSTSIECMDFDPSTTVTEALVVKDNEQMMYKVLVEVYSSDSYKDSPTKHMENSPLANMDGTFLDW